jgi:hypothetical protein
MAERHDETLGHMRMDIDTHGDDGQGLAIELQLLGLPRSATESAAVPHVDCATSDEFPGRCARRFGLVVGL